jgi:hypothetical protein
MHVAGRRSGADAAWMRSDGNEDHPDQDHGVVIAPASGMPTRKMSKLSRNASNRLLFLA